MKKKLITTLALVAVLTTITATPALAHGHGRNVRAATSTRYAVCYVADCTLAGTHKHNGVNYYGHSYADGHDYHGFCDITDCTLTGYHGHDGSYSFSHYSGDGHSYHSGGGHH